MNVVIERCAGLDVHKKTVVACVRAPRSGRAKERLKETRSFATTMKGFGGPARVAGFARRDRCGDGVHGRVLAPGVGDVGGRLPASAGQRPARQAGSGRKTDVRDCEWLAQLLECGLLKGSFVPSSEIRDLRDLTRLRKTLVRERSSQVNRVSKILELANVKLGSVVSNVMGVTARGSWTP